MSCLFLYDIDFLFFDIDFLFFFFIGFLAPCFMFAPKTIRMSRGDPRNIIEYRDLDAPDDMDFF